MKIKQNHEWENENGRVRYIIEIRKKKKKKGENI